MPTNKVREAIKRIIKFKTFDIVQTLADPLCPYETLESSSEISFNWSDDPDPRYHIITVTPLFANV